VAGGMRSAVFASACGVLSLAMMASALADGAGTRAAFDNHCRTCHSVRAGDHRLGPSLYGILGTRAGTVSGYGRSAQGLRESGLIWDEATLDRFIENPDRLVPNNGMKPYSGIQDAAVRRSIIEFLKTRPLSAAPEPARPPQ
jgi:cytochrome c